MAAVLLSADLMGASRIEGAARLSGVEFRTLATVDAAIEFCHERPVSLVMVDLMLPGLDVQSPVERLKSGSKTPPETVAYGPHVHEALLASAKAAGCSQVLSRGQFLSKVDAIVARYAGSESRTAE